MSTRFHLRPRAALAAAIWLSLMMADFGASPFAQGPPVYRDQPVVRYVDHRQPPQDGEARPTGAGQPGGSPTGADPGGNPADGLLNLSLEQLANTDVVVPSLDVVVSTVSRQESTIGRTPAAVFVITNDMIRRSGARTFPDVLRLAPGVDVARITASKFAVSIRGFNDRFANNLLVQIDGRAVYSPLFGGVFWDIQDYPLEDIERIEVIRGPGGTIWGANAVNGIINIITKDSRDTQGALVSGGGGNPERGFSTVRHGGQLGNLTWRAYAKQFERGPGFDPAVGLSDDDWRQQRSGFRADWRPTDDDWMTLSGDIYTGVSGHHENVTQGTAPFRAEIIGDEHVRGGNAIYRWRHVLDEGTDWQFQFYYDNMQREEVGFTEYRDTYDIDFQHRFPRGDFNRIIWGLNYRNTVDTTRGAFAFSLSPASRHTDVLSGFLQDEITLLEDRSYFTAGTKLETNDYTGFEYQPTARLLFLPGERSSAWASISRAVRLPTRVEDDMRVNALVTPFPFPTFVRVQGDRSVEAENVLAYELGYRAQPTDDFSWDVALFYNDHDDLIGTTPGTPFFSPPGFFIPLSFTNNLEGESYGMEWTGFWTVTPNWTLSGAYSFRRTQIHGADTRGAEVIEGSSPKHKAYLWSAWSLPRDWELDLMLRYVDSLPALDVRSYLELDARVGRRFGNNLELAVVGQNLLDGHHLEFRDAFSGTLATEVPRGIYGVLTWQR
jgi:iron complex outermembrane receptor protein